MSSRVVGYRSGVHVETYHQRNEVDDEQRLLEDTARRKLHWLREQVYEGILEEQL